ncbi:hypothetical protein OS42_21980 [Dickeya oryzae]
MKKSRFTEEQIVFALKQAELGTPVPGVCRKLGISDATFIFVAEAVFSRSYGYSGSKPEGMRRNGIKKSTQVRGF